jgi:hypothetical protein
MERIEQHGMNLLAIFPNATERDPVRLCKKLRRLERDGASFALRLCNGPEFPSQEAEDAIGERILRNVNKLLGNVREYQPKTGAKCGCNRGVQRDNCPACEGTGYAIDFARIRNQPPTVPVFLNRDPRGYALKIDDEWMRAHPQFRLHTDWGGYGIIAPEIEA